MTSTTSFEQLESLCQRKGLKLTGQRRILLRVLADAEDHPSVEMLYERAKAIDPTISMATVYRTINLLDEFDIVKRLEFKESFARYEPNWGHHHHLIDVDTGNVIEFENDEIEKMKIKIAEDLGYDLVECVLELYGKKRA